MVSIRIKPKSWELTAISLRIHIVGYKLKESANIVAELIDESGKVLERQSLVLEGNDFLLWGYDDAYIVDWILEKLGLELDTEYVEVDHLNKTE